MEIVLLKTLPKEFKGVTFEPNLLRYFQHQILLLVNADKIIGSVRVAMAVDKHTSGLVTDLYVESIHKNTGLEDSLIEAAENYLKAKAVTRVDAVYLDGPGILPFFYKKDYAPFRRTVRIEWKLDELNINSEKSSIYEIKLQKVPNIKLLSDLILDSFQPYWTNWIEEKTVEDRKKKLSDILSHDDNSYYIAFNDGKALGMVDKKLKWGIVIRRDSIGNNLGSYLLNRVLQDLKKQGYKKAVTFSTSGLDDYDPQIYLYTLRCGGKITREYIDLQKRF